MAQIFKSKELTFSVPEKESGEHPNCGGGTHYLSLACTAPCTGTIHTCLCTVHTCTCTVHTCFCSFMTPQHCALFTTTAPISPECPWNTTDPISPVEQQINEIKEVETLEMLKEKLSSALKDVEGKLKEAKGK
jgi:hypothetical protein